MYGKALFTDLSQNDTDASGTARKNQLKLHATFTSSNISKGEHRFCWLFFLTTIKGLFEATMVLYDEVHASVYVNQKRK